MSVGRILLVNQYYAPDMAATAQLLSDLGTSLAGAGVRVRALASRGRYMPPRGPRLRPREIVDGVHVVRLPCTNFGRGRAWRRLLDYGTYFALAALQLARARREDTVVVLSTPPLVALAGLVAKSRGARLVYKVEDLYPDVALALGALRIPGAGRVLSFLSGRVLAQSDAVVALDPGMAKTLAARGARPDRVAVIPNWADEHDLAPRASATSALRTKLGLPADTLVVGYSGNFGRAHTFTGLLEAAEELEKSGEAVHFLFTGDGVRSAQIAHAARARSNVTLLPYQPRVALGDTLAASDVHVVSLRPEVDGLLYPSKFAGILAAGRPVVGVMSPSCALAREINEAGVGWAPGTDGDAVCGALREAQDPVLREAMGVRARRHFEGRYRREPVLARWHRLLLVSA